jgi:hypothetical protein
MPIQDFINRLAVSNFSLKSANGRTAASGTVDWYTCPSGKKAAIIGFAYCTTTGSATVTPMFKSVGGSYYNMSAALTANAFGITTVGMTCGIILEAGETFASSQSTATVNVYVSIMEFDADAPIKTAKLLSLSSGNNTLYTVPAGKSATLLNGNLDIRMPDNNSTTNQKVIQYWNNSGGSRSVAFYVVPNGGSAGSSNRILATSPASVAAAAFLISYPMCTMNSGDFVVVNTDAATATQWTWVNVMEI